MNDGHTRQCGLSLPVSLSLSLSFSLSLFLSLSVLTCSGGSFVVSSSVEISMFEELKLPAHSHVSELGGESFSSVKYSETLTA